MENSQLTNFYDRLKGKLEDEKNRNDNDDRIISVSNNRVLGQEHPGAILYRQKAAAAGDKLREDCRKHILLDIYCKILPLDDEYKNGNMGQMKSDIDCMLQGKDMSATQYLTSCFESTNAPFVEYILRATDMIRDQFMEDANEKLKDAISQEMKISEPEVPDVESPEINDQLIDIKKDTEYDSFIDKLKAKTINKIVNDVTKIINDKKEEKNMTFELNQPSAKMESAVAVCMDYISAKFMKENVQITESAQEEIIGVAIRESVIKEIDNVFALAESDMQKFTNRIRFGKGYVCNEAAANHFMESVNK